MTDTLKLSVPVKPEYVGTVRLAISSLANKAGFDIEAIEDIKVAVSEACSNIVCHSTIDEDRLYNVICEIFSDRLSISVEDEGVGFDVNNIPEPDLSEHTGSGLGVFIIRALMDEVDVSSKVGSGTSIRMVKYLPETV
ncbi:MAG: ATP-binding protein [Clostridiales Family XIII bacterium]|jgi:serine/threonine-protein kinase RsbW|nr:ATP-binding protein [Clostridiales Family XIII bacterium]